jgi:hypothetical protein
MLRAFSNDKPETITSEAIYYPIVDGSDVLAHQVSIPSSLCLVSDFRESSIHEEIDFIWSDFKKEDETFDNFVERVQVWSYPTKDSQFLLLVNPEDPDYLFPDFVGFIYYYF